MADPIDKAITATEAEPLQMVRLPVQIGSTGRPCVLELPYDITESELAELCGFMLTQVLGNARLIAQQGATPRILVARGMPS
jgi:hypothetical protein